MFLNHVPSGRFERFWGCPLVPANMAPVSENPLRDFSFSFLLKFLFGKALFGRSLAQLLLAALSLYPFGVKEGQKRRFLSNVPFGRFCLACTLPPISRLLAHPGRFGCFWAGFLRAGTFGAGIWPSGLDLGPPKLESCLRWPPALKSELLLLPGAPCILLYGGGLSAYQPLYPFRPSSHKYDFFSRAP